MSPWIEAVLDIFFPPKCMFCGRIMETSSSVICPNCLLSELPEADQNLPTVPYFEKCAAVFRYEEPVSGSIVRFKFNGMASYGAQFAHWMAATVRDKLEGRYDLISWVPCSKLRIWTRGFDQAELLAKALSEELGVKAVRTLVKTKHNSRQSRTVGAAKRRANVLGVYRPYEPDVFCGKRILLVDDVLTTGATLSECGKTLRMAGSGDLVCAVIASAHRDHDK